MAAPKRPAPLLWMLLIVTASILAVTISGIIYTNYVARQNNRQWCAVLKSIDDAYEPVANNPNASPAGKHIADEFHRLRVEFSC